MSLMPKVRDGKYARTEREVVTEETSPLTSHFSHKGQGFCFMTAPH